MPTAPIVPTSIWSTAACPTTSACAACSTRWNCSRRCTTRACRRRSTTCSRIIVFVVNSLSSPPTNWDESEKPAGHGRHPAQGHRRSDRSLFLRGGRAAEGHLGAVERRRGAIASWPDADQTRIRRCAGDARRRRRRSIAIDVSFAALKDKASAHTSMSSRRPSCCRPRPSIACAPRRERSFSRRPSSSGC